MTPEVLEAVKWLLTFMAAALFAIGGYWCKNMADEIKELSKKQNKTDVFMAKMEEQMSGREKLQDERWKNLDSKITVLHSDVQALVHSQIKPKTESNS